MRIIMMAEGSRGLLWTAVLFLAAVSTCVADGNEANATMPAVSTGKTTITAGTNATQAAPTAKANATTNTTEAPAPKPSSITPQKNSTVPIPPAPPSTTKAPPPAPPIATTPTPVTTKGTVTSSTRSATTAAPAATGTMAAGGVQKTSRFDLGSFIGGIVLTVGMLAVAYFGCRFYNSKRGVRYRTIDEHEAII